MHTLKKVTFSNDIYENAQDEQEVTILCELTKREDELDDILDNFNASYSGKLTDEEIKAQGFEDIEQIEDTTFFRKRETLPNKIPARVVEEVWKRGCVLTNKDVACCYICDRLLKKDVHRCTCPTKLRDCQGCGAWQVEHVLAKHVDPTGRHVTGNLLPACAFCNCRAWKGTQTLVELVQTKGM